MGGLVQDTNGVGIVTGASVSWNSSNTWHNTSGFASPDNLLMDGYLDGETNGVPATASFSNLPGTAYDVYIYSADGTETTKESGGFFVNGLHVLGSGGGSLPGPNYVQTFPGVTGNYLLLSNVSVLPGGVINISDDGSSFRIPLNGVELVQVPEPAGMQLVVIGSLSLGLFGLFGFWVRQRRQGTALE